MKKLCPIALVLSLLAILASAQEPAQKRVATVFNSETLRGLPDLNVAVDLVGPELEENGLHAETVKTDVELRLRQNGIKISNDKTKSGFPMLTIVLNAHLRDGIYSYTIVTALAENVVTIRKDPVTVIGALTWYDPGSFGTIGALNVRQLRESFRNRVDKFCNAYLTANPK